MKIALILLNDFVASQPRNIFSFIGRKGAYSPTTLLTLASLIPDELNAEVSIIDELIESFDPHTIQAEIVGLSFTTCNAPYAYRLSKILREREIIVVFGGHHTTALPEEASKYADACVLGFAEKSWPSLLLDYKAGKLKKIYQEDYSKAFIDLKIDRYDLLKEKKYFYPYTIEFSRSCINSCEFCVIPRFSGNGMKYRPVESIVEDIKRRNANEIVFLDSSPIEDVKKFTELCYALKKLNIKWYSNITFKISDNHELIKLMSESGCRGILMGFESIDQLSLNNTGKSFNVAEDYKTFVKLLHKHKILVYATLIFGFDSDDKNIFKRTVDFVHECNFDFVHYAILTPFPGSAIYDNLKKENRIIEKDWSKYDSLHAIFKPKNMTMGELQQGYNYAHKKTHSLYSIFKRTLMSPARTWRIFLGNIALGVYGDRIIRNINKENTNN